MKEFRKELESLINRHSMENYSDTPDFILAEYLTDCLLAFDKACSAREHWYGRTEDDLKPNVKVRIFFTKNMPNMVGQPVMSFGEIIGDVLTYLPETGELVMQLFKKFEYMRLDGIDVGIVNLWGLSFGNIPNSDDSKEEKPGYPSRDNAELP